MYGKLTTINSNKLIKQKQLSVPVRIIGRNLRFPETLIYDSPGRSVDQRFRLLRNYFRPCCVYCMAGSKACSSQQIGSSAGSQSVGSVPTSGQCRPKWHWIRWSSRLSHR